MPRDEASLSSRTVANAQATNLVNAGQLDADEVAELVRLILKGNVSPNGLDLREQKTRCLTEDEKEDFRRYLVTHANNGKGLKPRTVNETLKCVRQLERPEDSQFTGPLPHSVPCRYPREEDWKERKIFEMDRWDGSGTNNRRKALRHVCKWQEIRPWPTLEGRIPPANRRKKPVPPRHVVPRFYAAIKGATHRDETFRHVAHLGFHTGWRISEIRDLNVSDVDFTANTVHYWSEKDDKTHAKPYEPFVVSATNGPSLRHYLDHVRPDPANGHEDAFFLTANGERWTYAGLRTKFSTWGKQFWEPFYPHAMRKFVAVEFLIANDFNIYRAAERIGDKVATVEDHYLDKARARAHMGTKYRMRRFRGGTP